MRDNVIFSNMMLILINIKLTWLICLMGVVTTFIYIDDAYAENITAIRYDASATLRTGANVDHASKAIMAAAEGKWADASSSAASSKDPVVEALVDWYLFRSNEHFKNFVPLAEFVKQYPDWPAVSSIRMKAERHFPDNYPDQYVYQWFSNYKPITYDGVTRFAATLKRFRKMNELSSLMAEWFPSASLNTNEQADILRQYRQQLSQDMLMKRYEKMLASDQYTNARAIAGYLPNGYRSLTEARVTLASNRKAVNALINKVPKNLQSHSGLILERATWRRKNDNIDGAVEVFLTLGEETSSDDLKRALWRERHILIRDLIERKRYQQAYRLAIAHQQTEGFPHAQAQWITGWIALRHMNKAMDAFYRFENLYKATKTPISKSRGAYWAGRASEALGDKETARIWYSAAARYPTVFYGQMALDKIGTRPNYNGVAERGMSSAEFKRNAKTRAVKYLYNAGQMKDAELFIRNMIQDATDGKIRFSDLSNLAKDINRQHLSVNVAKRAERNGHILLRDAFPKILSYTKNVPFEDKALIHGLIRQESAFNTQAVSRTGALGLMQLMPPTAKETAQKIGIRYSKSALSSDPQYNIRLGTYYISQMVDRFDGFYPLAIAAYNGGPGRVGRWTKEFGNPKNLNHEELIDWIEMIPVYETRNYVQRVTEAMRVYADIFQQAGYSATIKQAWNKKEPMQVTAIR